MGVAAALRAYLPNMRFSVVCGASAGALAGVSLLGDVPPGDTYSVLHMFHILLRRDRSYVRQSDLQIRFKKREVKTLKDSAKLV